MVVFPPKSCILRGFSIIFTIRFGGTPIFGNTHISRMKCHLAFWMMTHIFVASEFHSYIRPIGNLFANCSLVFANWSKKSSPQNKLHLHLAKCGIFCEETKFPPPPPTKKNNPLGNHQPLKNQKKTYQPFGFGKIWANFSDLSRGNEVRCAI